MAASPSLLPTKFSARSAFWTGLAAVLILAAGIALRLVDVQDAPLDFHPTRQLHSALIARGMYYANLQDAPEWQRERAVQQQQSQELIEPQIMERLTAAGYALLGRVNLVIPRLLSIFFWSLGAIGLFWLMIDLTGGWGALAALLVYMFMEYGVVASRAFQPDPLMTAAILWALWALLRYSRNPTWLRAGLAGILTGFALYVKLTAGFFLAGAWIGLLLTEPGLRRALCSRKVWLIGVLSILPYVLYHIYAASILGVLQSQFSLRFFPAMWLDWTFYLRWVLKAASVVPWPWLAVAAAGIFTLSKKTERAVWLGAGCGYVLYGFVFSYYVSTHDYYHLPLIPLAAVGVGAAVSALASSFKGPRWVALGLTAGLFLIWGGQQAWNVRSTLKANDYNAQVASVEAISAMFSPQDAIVSVAEDYSGRLSYWGWLNVTNWFSTGDFALRAAAGNFLDLQAYFEEQTRGKDYFLITDFEEFDRQPQVQKWLADQFPVYAQGEGYLVYDLHPKK